MKKDIKQIKARWERSKEWRRRVVVLASTGAGIGLSVSIYELATGAWRQCGALCFLELNAGFYLGSALVLSIYGRRFMNAEWEVEQLKAENAALIEVIAEFGNK